MTSGSPAALPSWLRPAILGLAALLLLACFSTEVTDSDTFFHLEAGKYVLEHHRLPLPDPFSFTTYLGKPLPGEEIVRSFNITHSWLGEMVIYLAYAAGGYGGMVVLRALLMTAFAGLACLWIWRRTRSFYRALLAAAVTAFISSYFASDRPYQITYVMIVVTLLTVESRRRLWVLPPLFLLWANLHGGYIMGFVVLGAYCAESLWQRLRGTPQPGERQLWLVSAASVVAAFFNPNGYLTLYILAVYRQSNLTQSIYEWQKPALWPPSFLNLLLLGALVVMLWQRRRTRVADWVLLGLFGAAYLSAVRNSNLAGLVGPAMIASYLPWKRVAPRSLDWAIAALLAIAVAIPFARGRAFQLRSAEWKYPAGAADFLLAHHVTQPMFHSFEKGGYLMWRGWPEQRSFVDGRSLNESVYADYQGMIKYLPGTRELLDRYGIQVVVMNAFEANSGAIYVLPLALADPAEKEWKMVFADAGAAIFMRQPPPGVTPLPSPRIFDSMESQCQVILDHDPARPRCARSLANLFRNMRDLARARRWMGLYLEHRPDGDPADDLFYQQLNAGGR
ncbi:MAG: hypothetical protein ABI759_27555 [Candidatus Solibacter sp.]